jgi:hypothetical protein
VHWSQRRSCIAHGCQHASSICTHGSSGGSSSYTRGPGRQPDGLSQFLQRASTVNILQETPRTRLLSTHPSSPVAVPVLQDNKYLLATCYRHCNQGYRAVHLLQGSSSQHCRYLAALCCLDLRQYKEAEQLLLQHGDGQVCLQAGCKVLLPLQRAANPCYSSSGTINGLSLYQSQQQRLSSSLQELCQVLGVLHTSVADVACSVIRPPCVLLTAAHVYGSSLPGACWWRWVVPARPHQQTHRQQHTRSRVLCARATP